MRVNLRLDDNIHNYVLNPRGICTKLQQFVGATTKKPIKLCRFLVLVRKYPFELPI